MFTLGNEKYSLAGDPHRTLKRWIWAYFLLLIFEGALRKWMLPSLSNALLIVRDPVAIVLIAMAWHRRVFVPNGYVAVVWLIGLVGLVSAVLVGHGNFVVAVYGLRIALLHFPLIFIIGSVFTRRDVLQLGRVVLLLCIPMTLLAAMQFYSPQSAWVNRGLAGSLEGAGFSGANDYMRPPGTFSFISGLAYFYGLVSSFVFYFLLNPGQVKRWLLIASAVSLMCAVPLSISRTVFFELLLSAVFAFAAASVKPKSFVRFAAVGLAFVAVFVLLGNFSFFRTATDTLSTRFESAQSSEGHLLEDTIGDRLLGGILRGVAAVERVPFFGYGIGMGTNAGSSLMTGGEATFLIAEDEWGRVIGEQGILFGLGFMLMRLWLAITLLLRGLRRISRGDNLGWLIGSFAAVLLVVGQWSQPTALGFSVLAAGLMVAALKNDNEIRQI